MIPPQLTELFLLYISHLAASLLPLLLVLLFTSSTTAPTPTPTLAPPQQLLLCLFGYHHILSTSEGCLALLPFYLFVWTAHRRVRSRCLSASGVPRTLLFLLVRLGSFSSPSSLSVSDRLGVPRTSCVLVPGTRSSLGCSSQDQQQSSKPGGRRSWTGNGS